MVCMSEPQEGGGGEGAEFLNISYSLVAFNTTKEACQKAEIQFPGM